MVVIELLVEIFGEAFIDLSSALVPNKELSEKAKKIIGVIFGVIAMAALICLLIGVALLCDESENYKEAGGIFILVFAIYFVIVIIANVIKLIRKHRLK